MRRWHTSTGHSGRPTATGRGRRSSRSPRVITRSFPPWPDGIRMIPNCGWPSPGPWRSMASSAWPRSGPRSAGRAGEVPRDLLPAPSRRRPLDDPVAGRDDESGGLADGTAGRWLRLRPPGRLSPERGLFARVRVPGGEHQGTAPGGAGRSPPARERTGLGRERDLRDQRAHARGGSRAGPRPAEANPLAELRRPISARRISTSAARSTATTPRAGGFVRSRARTTRGSSSWPRRSAPGSPCG